MHKEQDFFDPLSFMRRRMLDMFGGLPAAGDERQPLVDVVDKESEIVVSAELPGVEKENIELSVDEDSLSISAESREEANESKEERGYYFHERSYSSYNRTIPMPAKIIPEKASAEFNNGILTVVLQKEHPEEPKGKGFKVEVQ